jgi:peroxiredoxin
VCRTQLGELQSAYMQFGERNAEILALAVQNMTGAQSMDEAVRADFPILADAEHAVSGAYGVFNLLGDGVAAPAVFVIDAQGQIVWSYVGKDVADRPSPAEILAHLP